MTLLQEYLDESEENRISFAREGLIVEVSEAIYAEMEKQELKKVDLAKKLGKSKPDITRLLNGHRNMTLRTLADICYALGVEAKITLVTTNSLKP